MRMADDVPFDKSFDLEPDRVKEVAPLVRAVAANNPSPFTFKGTVSYIVGRGKVAILDPGPDDDAHVAALLDAVRGETVTHIFVTHTHRDHSPAVPKIKAATGAKVFAEGPHRLARPLHIGETRRLDASADMDFRPDVALADGEIVSGDGWTLEALTTPGHTANHMAFAFPQSDLIFSGDHVMGWSTTIVAPPDGAMSDYMASLHKLVTTRRAALSARPRQPDPRCAPLRPASDRAPPWPRSLDPAPARQGRSRHSDHRQSGLYRPRPAPHRRCRPLGAGAHGGTGRARRRLDRRAGIDRRHLSLGGRALGRRRLRFWRRGRRLLRQRQHVVDIADQVAHPRRIGAEVVAAVA